MTETNFMLQDIGSTLLGFLIFPLVLMVPGYLAGWWLNILDFRARLLHSRLALSLLLSVAISPVIFYLLSSLFSFAASFLAMALFFVTFAVLIYIDRPVLPSLHGNAMKWVIACVFIWIVFALFLLVDIQWGRELYFSVVAYDQTTRVSIVDAMTRTGVPPVNPSYYPGRPVQMNFLYFFWYILGSMVDQLGGTVVDARGAFFASTIWGGIALMTAIAFYLRLRNKDNNVNIWTLVLIGIGLLTITGLDFLPVSLAMRYVDGAVGDIEHWNEQITAWIGSLLWVPHHVAALVACLVGTMLALSMRGQSTARQYMLMTVAGTAFASAFGLSVWVTLVFVIFWGAWILAHLIQRKDKHLVFPMAFAGVIALVLSSTFLLGIFSGFGGSDAGRGFPVTFEVRSFSIVDGLVVSSPKIIRSIFRLVFLPINYFFELGFYFFVGIIWLKQKRSELYNSPYYLMEIILFGTAFFIGTFMRSTLIENNDLGWRAWLPGQFVLLIWGVDILRRFNERPGYSPRTKFNLTALVVFGIITTLMDVTLLRSTYYLAFGHEVGEQIFSARRAYTVINQTLPEDIVVQYNPASTINRPSGLYGMRQSAISDRTAYGLPQDVYLEKVSAIRKIFEIQNALDWQSIDALCDENFIDTLVIVNDDVLWSSLDVLKEKRVPLYMDKNYAVFTCGN